MTIKTRPRIYYIDAVSSENNLLNFIEPNNPPGLELTASLFVGSRSMTKLMIEVERALNDAGENVYTVTFDRSTRIVTISADDTFELLVSSGSNVGVSPFSLLGFTGSDRTGASSYVGDTAIGNNYVPQFLPQQYTSFDDNLEGTESSLNESAAGVVEVVTFGETRFMEMNLTFITDIFKGKANPINNNQSAIQETRNLMEFLIRKSEVEIMLDKDDVNTFDNALLESTKKSRQGTSYQLNELVGRGLNDHYETGVLKFRKVN